MSGEEERISEGHNGKKYMDAKEENKKCDRINTRIKNKVDKEKSVLQQKAIKEQYSESLQTPQMGAGKKDSIRSSKVYLESRCCIRKFAEFVSTFHKEKVEVVKQLGLDCLLRIQCQNLKNELICC